jgi:hypothetical protein
LRDIVNVDIDDVALPSAQELDLVARNALSGSGDCGTLAEGVSGVSSGWDAGAEEIFADFVDEILPRERPDDA